MRTSRAMYVTGFVLLVSVLSAFSSPTPNVPPPETNNVTIMDGAVIYQQNFTDFKYYIGSIGMVTINSVALDSGVITAVYSYSQGSEIRHVVSELSLDVDGLYKGTCTTKVKGKTLFSVNTWLAFEEDGTATGNWSWSGNPSTKDPIVKISKL